mmetsp:Transcript_34016/g.109913  ORF Transcript_34016/g.109913 Transcript_34016/m.109913 type:complete len:243 (-) Transcript_34016:1858-2586(-)
MVSSVCSANSSLSSACMAASDPSSRLEVASSRMRMRASPSMARAKQSSCRSPEDRLAPPLVTWVASISAGSRARTSAERRSDSGMVPNGHKLCETVPSCSTGSCGMMVIARRSALRPSKPVGCPSIRIEPEAGSTSRKSASTSVDLPAPVRPTMPTLEPASTVAVRLVSASGSPGRYRMQSCWNWMWPAVGHCAGEGSEGRACGGSCGRFMYSSRRSSAAKAVRIWTNISETMLMKYGTTAA